MKVFPSIVALFFIQGYYCQGKGNTEKMSVNGYDISKNNKTILLSSNIKNISSIYTMNLDSSKARLLISGTETLSFFNPQYSTDEKKITFIGYFDQNVNNSAIFIANSDGSDVRQITAGNEIIKQVLFSIYDSNVVIYTKANVYQSYSPFGVAQAHDFDIYNVDIRNKKQNKVSNFKAYILYAISELDTNDLLITLPGSKEGGMFLFNKESSNLKRIVPSNDPRKNPSIYFSPKFSEKFNVLIFYAPYELYSMDMKTGIASTVYRSKPKQDQIVNFRLFHDCKMILFKINGESGLYTINFDGTEIKKVDIEPK